MKRKWLTTGIILLLIGIGLSPSIIIKGCQPSSAPVSQTLTFHGHWFADPNGTRHGYYEKDGQITIIVKTMGLGKIIGIGTMNSAWSTSDDSGSGTLTGRFYYRYAPHLYRGIHRLFIGTKTQDSDESYERILGNFVAFGSENYWGSDWRTPSIAYKWIRGRSPSI